MGYIDDAFAKLKSNLEITQTEQDTAVRRHTSIRDYVKPVGPDRRLPDRQLPAGHEDQEAQGHRHLHRHRRGRRPGRLPRPVTGRGARTSWETLLATAGRMRTGTGWPSSSRSAATTK